MSEPQPDPVRAALGAFLIEDAGLAALAPGGVHHDGAPAGTVYPYVVYGRPGNTPVWSFRDFTRSQLWLVKGICRGRSATAAEAIDIYCEGLLNGTLLDIEGMEMPGPIRRENGMPDLSEPDSSDAVYQRGGYYRVYAEMA